MNYRRHPTNAPPPSLLAIGCVLAAVAVLFSLLAARRTDLAPAPFVWRDVALISFLGALPLAMLIAAEVQSRMAAFYRLLLAASLGVLAIAVVVWLPAGAVPAGTILRCLVGLSLAVAELVLFSGIFRAGSTGSAEGSPSRRLASSGTAHLAGTAQWLVAALVAVGLPACYVQARCEHDAGRLAGLIEQSRLGEAAALANHLARLQPQRRYQAQTLVAVARQLSMMTALLHREVQLPLPGDAPAEARLERARQWAILGETSPALETIWADPSLRTNPQAAILCGTIYETRQEWPSGLAAYTHGRNLAARMPPSAERAAAIEKAWMGIAYCERKLGRYAAAQAAYGELLALSPTPDTHFLLAQFYEDAQNAEQAQYHARRAMALDPARFEARGKLLIDKLITRHFGCWGAFSAEAGSNLATQ